jgi:hypothetical protein
MGGLLSAIRGTGGAGVLKKVPDSVKRDRSAAAVPGGVSDAPPPPGAPPAAPAGGLANALADALNKRKKKVGGSGVFDCPQSQYVLTTEQTTKKTMTMIGEHRLDQIYILYSLQVIHNRAEILEPSNAMLSTHYAFNHPLFLPTFASAFALFSSSLAFSQISS